MAGYIGRQAERREFAEVLAKKTASLVTCQGRRRVGKSRFIEECAAAANHFLSFIGLSPREGIARQEQLDAFGGHLAKQTAAPRVAMPDWPTAFQLLASQLPAKGSVVVLFDEILWATSSRRSCSTVSTRSSSASA